MKQDLMLANQNTLAKTRLHQNMQRRQLMIHPRAKEPNRQHHRRLDMTQRLVKISCVLFADMQHL